MVKSRVVVTNAGGVHPTPISEHVIGLMLCLCRKLHLFIRNQVERKWERFESWASAEQVEELSGKTVGIVGLGRIGTEIAQKAKCLGMRVIATKRDPSHMASTSVDELLHPDDLNQLLAESDFVVLSLPLTKETEEMIGEARFKSMKRTGYLINVSRGRIVQEDKLIEALKQGWIAGAGLDTFDNEPLPEGSELWGFRKCNNHSSRRRANTVLHGTFNKHILRKPRPIRPQATSNQRRGQDSRILKRRYTLFALATAESRCNWSPRVSSVNAGVR